jgi:chromosomal replication initiator protein
MTAARAVSEQPGVRYNPLFIYGGVGLGKTHLLHAIAHHIGQIHPEKHVVYVSSESYVNDLISAIRSNGMDKFRLKYRDQCDVLLIDDIQFIAGKDRTQEEFFHMFNTLHSFGKQIVLTSDQLPRSIPDLEDRLKSRFEWGLIADIKPPSFETRAAIVTVKAEEKGIFLPEEVAMFLARHVSRNVRELEGALMRLVATSQMFGTSITIQMTRDILSELVDKTLAYVSIPSIIKAVSDEFDLTAQDLKGPRRQRHITIPRQVAMHLARQLTKSSLPQIGAAFGGRDHTTVINGLKRVELLKSADPNLKRRIDGLFKQLRP